MNKREKEGSSMPERKYKFERLTPIDNMDLDVYEDALNYVFENSDIKNVAISGAYSAGKSSVFARQFRIFFDTHRQIEKYCYSFRFSIFSMNMPYPQDASATNT